MTDNANFSEDYERLELIDMALGLVRSELMIATKKFDNFNSAHEGYAVILEELDELWEEVKCKQDGRSQAALLEESTQVATMGARFMIDIILRSTYGRSGSERIPAPPGPAPDGT